jgi:transposase-like protein
MARPLSYGRRQAILDAIAAGGTRNQVARDLGVSPGAVSRYARQAGHSFDRAPTAAAVLAARIDSAELRTRTARRLLDEANALLDDLGSAVVTIGAFGGRDNTWSEHQAAGHLPRDKRDLALAAGALLDRHLAIAAFTAGSEEQSPSDVDSWLASVTGQPDLPAPSRSR